MWLCVCVSYVQRLLDVPSSKKPTKQTLRPCQASCCEISWSPPETTYWGPASKASQPGEAKGTQNDQRKKNNDEWFWWYEKTIGIMQIINAYILINMLGYLADLIFKVHQENHLSFYSKATLAWTAGTGAPRKEILSKRLWPLGSS